MLGKIGWPSHSDRTKQFIKKRTLTVYSCACKQTEENDNMLFVMSAMRNIQKHRRDHGVVFSVTMNWSSLVTMSYVICRFVLTCGGVPRITWEVHSGLIIRKVVLSVRGCLIDDFFQAEDGIRDRSPSRGLGDVYKRQLYHWATEEIAITYILTYLYF